VRSITLAQAARLAGLAPKTLRDAAERGALKAERVNPRLWLTTEQALRAYLDGRPERFKQRAVTAEGER
jgi:lambda repressor-like predicted transcriptional regulator